MCVWVGRPGGVVVLEKKGKDGACGVHACRMCVGLNTTYIPSVNCVI